MTYWTGTNWAPEPLDVAAGNGTRNRTAQAIIEALLIVVLLTGLFAMPALAARGGRAGAATQLSFAPSTVTVGDQYVVTGTGFRAGAWVTIGARYADTTWWGSAQTDARGTLHVTFTASSPGTIAHDAYEQGRNGQLRLKGSAQLTVGP